MTLLDQIRASLRDALDARSAQQTELDSLVSAAEERADGEGFTADEASRFAELRTALTAADADIEAFTAREAELADAEARKAAAADLSKRIGGAPAPVVRVTSEPEIYRRDGEHSFFGDALRAQFSYDREAQDRLARHAAAAHGEARDVGTSAFGALIPPQYLVDLFAPNLAAGRAFSNAVSSAPLPPSGMTLNIPRGTTATGVAVQSNEGDAVQETNFDETTLAVSVKTYAGQQDVSRQSLERGSGIDAIIFNDLAAQYAVALNTANITSALAVSGIGAVTYTDASPTVAELYPKLANAVQTVNSNRFMPATVIFMHPRRWGWMTAALSSTSQPLISTDVPDNTVGLGKAAEYGQVVGQVLGVPVITDACISTGLGTGTDEDIIIVAKADDILLWETSPAPQELRFEQTNGGNLQVKLVAYGYSAFTAGRYPKGICTVGGTGLVAPTF